MVIKIDRFASVVLVYCGNTLLTNKYDNTYPLEAYRERINLIGGCPDKKDFSPLDTLKREINEEFNSTVLGDKEFDENLRKTVGSGAAAPKIHSFASHEEIALIRNGILEGISPLADFLIAVPKYGSRPSYNVLFNVYTAELPERLIHIAQRNIKEGKSLVSEGFMGITSLETIRSGKVNCAWATGPVVSHFFDTAIPNPDGIGATTFPGPRENYVSYNKDFTIVRAK